MVKLPVGERYTLPFQMTYGPFAHIMSLMDGKRTLADLIREVEWEKRKVFTENELKDLIDATQRLARGGYLTLEIKNPVTRASIAASLSALGVAKGDTVLVHAATSGLGYIEGGAQAVIEGFFDVLGEAGNLLAPAFTRPYVGFEGTLNKSTRYRPFHPGETAPFTDGASISTGLLPKTLLGRPDAVRSAHASHSWVAVGPDAQALTQGHDMLGPPASDNSPMAKALARGGKVVFFGCGIAPNTFLHFLEDSARAPFLQNGIVKIRDADGRLHTEVIPRHLPGHRDWYRRDAENAKFYRRAVERGLDIRSAALGAGRVYVMDLQQLHKIGRTLVREDPRIMLCDDPACLFCREF